VVVRGEPCLSILLLRFLSVEYRDVERYPETFNSLAEIPA
jgi:hypothetical protein